MRKLLMLILMFMSYVSYGQLIKFDRDQYGKNFGGVAFFIGQKLDFMIDWRFKNFGGIGLDLYNKHVIDGVKKDGWGLYFLTPSIRKIEGIVGLGLVSDYLPEQRYQSVSGYRKSNGTYVNSYTRSGGTELVPTNTKIYPIVGVGKRLKFNGFDDLELNVRYVVRFLPTGVTPDIQFGISLLFPD